MTGARERKRPSKTDLKNVCMRRMRGIMLPLSNWAEYLQDKKVQGEGNSKFKFYIFQFTIILRIPMGIVNKSRHLDF